MIFDLGIIHLEKRLRLKDQTLDDYLHEQSINRQELRHRIAWQIQLAKIHQSVSDGQKLRELLPTERL